MSDKLIHARINEPERDVHETIRFLNLNTCGVGERFYGTCDPLPNASELLLTGLLSNYGLNHNGRKSAVFIIYKSGPKNYSEQTWQESEFSLYGIKPLSLKMSLRKMEKWLSCKLDILTFEDIMDEAGISNLKLFELVNLISEIRVSKKRFKIFYGSNEKGEVNEFFTRQNLLDYHDMTISELHENGGWLSGNGLHFAFREWMKKKTDKCLIVPWNDKGNVFQIYSGLERDLNFILCPALYLIPEKSCHWGNTVHINWLGALIDEWEKRGISNGCFEQIKNQFFSCRKRRIIFKVAKEGITLINS